MLERVQRYGGFLAGMVIPNIGAILAWGLITAFFIPTGWIPNENLGKIVGPMITYLLPILIGYTGGKLIYGHRGGVIGAVMTTGVVVGAGVIMFLGAMIAGPLAAWLLTKTDELLMERVPSGFEMLYNNFSSGILGFFLAIIGFLGIGPLVTAGSEALGSFVDAIISAGLLPIADIPIEVAKVLFLNNAINHGVLAPLGVAEVAQSGKAIHFLLETNPGPGLG
ncbi:MAG TPA: PTS transporter subunit EIIC, partial [Candidatus Limnocylindrales bacterium]|nr:PTS transporter subunit EIIC [Candidatus Limnocylindrales bacterium]